MDSDSRVLHNPSHVANFELQSHGDSSQDSEIIFGQMPLTVKQQQFAAQDIFPRQSASSQLEQYDLQESQGAPVFGVEDVKQEPIVSEWHQRSRRWWELPIVIEKSYRTS